MIVAIDQNICTGCRECAEVCPAFAIEGDQGKPQTINTDRCVMCGQCVQKCKSYVSILTHGKEAYEKVKKERNIPDSVTEPLFAAYPVCNLDKVKAALADPNSPCGDRRGFRRRAWQADARQTGGRSAQDRF